MSKTAFKKGDFVIPTCDRVAEGYFTLDQEYEVLEVNDGNTIYLRDDDGDRNNWENEEFILVDKTNTGSVNSAEQYVGKVVVYNRKKLTVDGWCKITPAILYNDTPQEIFDIVEASGFCFCLCSNDVIFPVSKTKIVDNRVVLTDDYTALIGKDVINVGCQTIPFQKVLDIVAAHEELYGK